MRNLSQPNSELSRDLEDCRQLVPLIFAEESGTQDDISYAPLRHSVLNPYSVHFLRMMTQTRDDVDSASIEVVEHNVFDGKGRPRMTYGVTEGAVSVDSHFERLPYLGDAKLFWPRVLGAPQVDTCVSNFKEGGEENEVEADELLDELTRVRTVRERQPHIRLRYMDGLELDEYSIDLLHRKHAMPNDLADIIQVGSANSEFLKIVARYHENPVLDVTVAFIHRKQNMVVGYLGDVNEAPPEPIRALANFKRAVFGDHRTTA